MGAGTLPPGRPCYRRSMHDSIEAEVLAELQALLPGWSELSLSQVHFEPPKGFSSFTMVVKPKVTVSPPGVLYRRLEGKDNPILDSALERRVYMQLSDLGIAARCLHYGPRCRLETLYSGRTLRGEELLRPEVQRGIAAQLHRFHHQPTPEGLPAEGFFTLLHRKWGPMARRVLTEQAHLFPEHERALIGPLQAVYSEQTAAMVQRCLPSGPLRFCHNDSYHGNIFRLSDGAIRLLDFEFSCLNHRAFDFANLFAETVMRHGLEEPPHFDIAAPEYTREHVEALVGFYLEHDDLPPAERAVRTEHLVEETLQLIPLSDYMYSMAALPLAVQPVQKIRFLPYAARRFARFQASCAARFGAEV